MKLFILTLISVMLNCTTPKYHLEKIQAGLLEPVMKRDTCTVIQLDTIYNPLGGVVKVITYKCIGDST